MLHLLLRTVSLWRNQRNHLTTPVNFSNLHVSVLSEQVSVLAPYTGTPEAQTINGAGSSSLTMTNLWDAHRFFKIKILESFILGIL